MTGEPPITTVNATSTQGKYDPSNFSPNMKETCQAIRCFRNTQQAELMTRAAPAAVQSTETKHR